MPEAALLASVPGFHQIDESFFKEFNKDFYKIRSGEGIQRFIAKWQAVWEMDIKQKPEIVREMDKYIISELSLDGEDLYDAFKCIKKIKQQQLCSHAPWGNRKQPKKKRHIKKAFKGDRGGLCAAMEMRMPWTLTRGVIVSHEYGVPIGIAMHQLFCEGPHDNCF